MLKVVIVDDEPSVLEGLRLFIDWNKEGFEIVGEASDGISAYPVIRDKRPDLVICDIRMPGLTGLELIEKIKAEINPIPKFLMLSGYNDFTYAQHALHLGAVGYLTKPLDSNELLSELYRVSDMLEADIKNNHENIELIRYTANQSYVDIIGGKRSQKLARKVNFIFGIPENAKIRVVRFVAMHEDDVESHSEIYDLLLRITGIDNENCVFYNGNHHYLVLLHDGLPKFPHHTLLVEQFSNHLRHLNRENLKRYSFWAFISGISSCGLFESIINCNRQVEQLHTYCMLHPENQVLSYEAISGNSTFQSETDIRVVLPESAFDRIVSAINGNDANRVSSSVEAFFADLYQKVRHRQLLSVCLYRLADVVRKIASSYGIEAGRVILDFTRAVGSHNPNCKKLAHVMCIHLFNKLNEHSDKPINLLENEIIEYIKKNYRRKSFSIQHISERFSLPTMVISKIVKKKTGKKFNDYVNYLRIEYAKTLFASEDIKTTAVCCDSGYSDYGYFSRKFKQFTGVLPSTYKKRYN